MFTENEGNAESNEEREKEKSVIIIDPKLFFADPYLLRYNLPIVLEFETRNKHREIFVVHQIMLHKPLVKLVLSHFPL